MRNFILFIALLCVTLFADDAVKASLFSQNTGIVSRSNIALQPATAESAVDSSYVLGPGDFLDLMLEENYLSVQVSPDADPPSHPEAWLQVSLRQGHADR